MSGLFEQLATDEPVDRFDYEEGADQIVHRRVQDVQPFLDRNKELLNDGDGYSKSREWRRIATIPNIIVEQLLQKGISVYRDEDWPKIAALLDSPEYAWLRTAPGCIGRGRNRSFFTGHGSRKSFAEIVQDLHDGRRTCPLEPMRSSSSS